MPSGFLPNKIYLRKADAFCKEFVKNPTTSAEIKSTDNVLITDIYIIKIKMSTFPIIETRQGYLDTKVKPFQFL